MWIRSKNREVLANVKAIVIDVNTEHHYFAIKGFSDDMYYLLGVYKTKEKTMSVLDELQCRIARSESGVFQMPEDEEWNHH